MPTKKRATQPERERRVYSAPITVRAKGNKKLIRGTAAVFAPKRSSDLGGWFEEIDRHAFDKALASPSLDCVALWNHDTNHVLGRSTSGTLRLSTTAAGLQYEIDPPDTSTANDLIQLMERGDVHQSSFGFVCVKESWREENGIYIRTVLEAELFDVSPVTFPAYPDATSGYRASLRNAPDALRSKLTERDEEDENDPACDPDSVDYDPTAECDDDDPELDTLRLRLRLATARAKRFNS
jgi:HK97 family phage prohead protease